MNIVGFIFSQAMDYVTFLNIDNPTNKKLYRTVGFICGQSINREISLINYKITKQWNTLHSTKEINNMESQQLTIQWSCNVQ